MRRVNNRNKDITVAIDSLKLIDKLSNKEKLTTDDERHLDMNKKHLKTITDRIEDLEDDIKQMFLGDIDFDITNTDLQKYVRDVDKV